MSIIWLLITLVEQSPGQLELPPKEDPLGRLVITIAILLSPTIPYFVARVQAKKTTSNGPAPLSAPALSAGQEYLREYIQNLEKQVKESGVKYEERLARAEAKIEVLSTQNAKLIEDRAVYRTQAEGKEAQLIAAMRELDVLRDRMRGRDRG